MTLRVLPIALSLLLAAPAFAEDVPIPKKIPSPTADDTAPTVSIRTESNGDVVEEYRQGGALYMVRVTPKGGRGVSYTLMDSNGDGKLDKQDAEDAGGVSPVYYTVYEWN